VRGGKGALEPVNAREKLKMRLFEERGYACEVLPYLEHSCPGAQDMHEAIYSRGDVQGIKGKAHGYIDDERNVVLVCNHFHVTDGHTEAYTRACVRALVARYGLDEIRTYIFLAPFKIATPGSRLAFWMGEDDA